MAATIKLTHTQLSGYASKDVSLSSVINDIRYIRNQCRFVSIGSDVTLFTFCKRMLVVALKKKGCRLCTSFFLVCKRSTLIQKPKHSVFWTPLRNQCAPVEAAASGKCRNEPQHTPEIFTPTEPTRYLSTCLLRLNKGSRFQCASEKVMSPWHCGLGIDLVQHRLWSGSKQYFISCSLKAVMIGFTDCDEWVMMKTI